MTPMAPLTPKSTNNYDEYSSTNIPETNTDVPTTMWSSSNVLQHDSSAEPVDSHRKPSVSSAKPTKNQSQKREELSDFERWQNTFSISENIPQDTTGFNPDFEKITGKNFAEVLVRILRKYSSHIPLDDFYNLLYNPSTSTEVISTPVDGIKIHRNHQSSSRSDAINSCRRIIQNWQIQCSKGASSGRESHKRPTRHALTIEEVLRMFLALKILLDSLKVSTHPSASDILPRISIYKAYYILCKKLMHKYPTYSKHLTSNIILCQARMGRVVRLAYPGIVANRKGKRGDSSYHYRNISWNPSLIGEEIEQLVQLSLPELENHFNTPPHRKGDVPESFSRIEKIPSFDELASSSMFIPVGNPLASLKPSYSFVDFSNTLLSSECFLRSWERIPGYIPQQSEWSKSAMSNSIEALRRNNIDIEHYVRNLQQDEFCTEAVGIFFGHVLGMLRLLTQTSASEEAYLHIYLIVLLLFSPIIFASDKEVQYISRSDLSNSLIIFVTSLETDFAGFPSVNQTNLMSFAKVLRKMINCLKLLSSRVPKNLAEQILRVMGCCPELPLDSQVMQNIEEAMVDISTRAIITAFNSFNWEFVPESHRHDFTYQEALIQKLASRYMEFYKTLYSRKPEILKSIANRDSYSPIHELPFELSWQSIQVFHEVFLSDPIILQFPCKLIEMVVLTSIYGFQTEAFNRFGILDKELSQTAFKCYWIYTSVVQEYISILPEIVSLSARISRVD